MKRTRIPYKSKVEIPPEQNDHSGTDSDTDKTISDPNEESRFDKPKRETDPDTTGIDTQADKTKK